MKRGLFLILIIVVMSITGCSSGEKWKVEIEQEPAYQNDALVIKVTDNGNPVSDLSVIGIFNMVKMDHGDTEIEFIEQQNGMYEAQFHLPMPGEWTSTIMISNNETTVEEVVEFEVEENSVDVFRSSRSDGVFATINDEEIQEEEVEFYKFVNKVQIAYFREVDKGRFEGEELEKIMKFWDAKEIEANNVHKILEQIIRLKTMALVATEKGYEATKDEVDAEVNVIKGRMMKSSELLENDPTKEMIEQYGSDKFWKHQESQYELIVLANKVQQEIIDSIRKDHPDADQEEVASLAQQKYEDLLTSKRESLDIEMFIEKVTN